MRDPRWLLASLLMFVPPAWCEELKIAVASNFAPVLEAMAPGFLQESGHGIISIPGSTGKHYAQIVNGAPYDVLLAADAIRPTRLEADGLAVADSRVPYAVGRIVLWSGNERLVDENGAVLKGDQYQRLAMANPELAPYGRAARETLQTLGLWEQLRSNQRLVQGQNIAQAFQFVHSGNAELGFVALSQVQDSGGSRWLVPVELHTPIEQQAILLRDSPAGRQFMRHLRSPEAAKLIRQFGYDTPP